MASPTIRRVVITPRLVAASADPIRRVWTMPKPGRVNGDAVLTWEDAVAALPVKARARRQNDGHEAITSSLARSRSHGATRQHRAYLEACRTHAVAA